MMLQIETKSRLVAALGILAPNFYLLTSLELGVRS
jgi:hypothetical protein